MMHFRDGSEKSMEGASERKGKQQKICAFVAMNSNLPEESCQACMDLFEVIARVGRYDKEMFLIAL